MASLRNRDGIFYAQYYVAGHQRRVSLETDSVQVAKEKLRKLETSLYRDHGTGLAIIGPAPERPGRGPKVVLRQVPGVNGHRGNPPSDERRSGWPAGSRRGE